MQQTIHHFLYAYVCARTPIRAKAHRTKTVSCNFIVVMFACLCECFWSVVFMKRNWSEVDHLSTSLLSTDSPKHKRNQSKSVKMAPETMIFSPNKHLPISFAPVIVQVPATCVYCHDLHSWRGCLGDNNKRKVFLLMFVWMNSKSKRKNKTFIQAKRRQPPFCTFTIYQRCRSLQFHLLLPLHYPLLWHALQDGWQYCPYFLVYCVTCSTHLYMHTRTSHTNTHTLTNPPVPPLDKCCCHFYCVYDFLFNRFALRTCYIQTDLWHRLQKLGDKHTKTTRQTQ